MKYPELTAILSDTSFSRILMDGLAIAHTDTTHFTNRLVACWNACREFDDPEKGVEDLRSRLRTLEQFLALRDNKIRQMKDDDHRRQAEIVDSRLRIDALSRENASLRVELSKAMDDKPFKIPARVMPEVNVQGGAYQPSGKIQPLTDPIEESLEVLADLVELWKRNRSKGRSAVSIRGAILLTVADIHRLTSGCQTK